MKLRLLTLTLLVGSAFAQGTPFPGFVVAAGGAGSISIVNHKSATEISGTFVASVATAAINTAAHNGIFVWCGSAGGHPCGLPTDTAGDTFTNTTPTATTLFGGDLAQTVGQWFYTCDSAGSTSNVITGNVSGTDQFVGVIVYVTSGQSTASCVDVANVGLSNSFQGSPGATSSFNTSTANEIVLYAALWSSNAATVTAGAGFTLDENQPSTNLTIASESESFGSIQSGITASLAFGAGDFRISAGVLTIK